MKTISAIKKASEVFEKEIRDICAETKEEYQKSISQTVEQQILLLKRIREIDPILAPLLLRDETLFAEEEATNLFNRIIECSKNRKRLNMVFTGACASHVIQRYSFAIPKYINFDEVPHVLIWPYEDQGWEDFAVKMMNQIILGSLLALPLGKVRISFFNPSLTYKANFFIGKIPSEICRTFVDKIEIKSFTDSLTNRLKSYLRSGKSGIEGLPDYEIVALLDYPYMFDGLTEDMRLLIEQGGQTGIHFLVTNDLRRNFENEDSYDILDQKNLFADFGAYNNAKQEDYDQILTSTYELASQPELLNKCFEYLNEGRKEGVSIESADISSKKYAQPENGLCIPIGRPIDSKAMDFFLGQDGHVHSFIIGATGTGKSVLLHNIIIETISKYSPEDLQLYLLDCKLGGVEFNRYKDVKHVRALLVDNSDIQVVLEILRDLSEQMKERGKALRDAGVQKIDDYNHSHPGSKMSRIWVVIDECHVLFEQHNSNDRKVRTEIIDIITKVATEGRSQGVHLIMATQTLANTDIPTAILNNITDRYILNCAPVDAEKMWANSSRYINKLGQGDVYYHNISNALPDTQFHTFYHTPKEAKERIDKAIEKASDLKSNGQFYFDGSQIFHIDQETIDIITNTRRGNLKAIPGKSINLKQTPACITLKQDMSENILVTGIDDQEQSMRTVMGLLCSLVISNTKMEHNYKFYVFDYKDDEEGDYQDVLEFLEKTNCVTIVRKRETGYVLKKLTDDIKNNNAEPSVLFLLGQQRFRGLKLDSELEERQDASNSIFGNNGFTSSPNTGIKTYKQALSYILDNGPEFHIHTVLQVDKPSNLLFEDYVTSKFVFKKFRHLIMLKSDDKAALNLGLPDEIRLDTLNSEPERLRAIYYADGDDGWTLFSPFAIPNKNELSNLTNKQ